ncbi:unnamed protein product [Commensalibacter communis]|uniref:hypothetical protein n=1 Tax=Commensalibacter communis TaxID=2972786 RepID=UPI0022FFAF4D|nr:hypothetical protein [Commensalibacter communis]CAI3955414.1 unnamed protein product [Commensalibacter communis]CAI3956166.1 unnamed protein product [Commensalibacter communis]
MASSKELPKEDFNQGLMDAMARGIASGVGNFFSNMWIAAGRFQEDFLGFDDYDGSRAIQNIDDDIRCVKAVMYISENIDVLLQIIGIIIEDTMSKLSYEQRQRVG